jgi:hypothetical protein
MAKIIDGATHPDLTENLGLMAFALEMSAGSASRDHGLRPVIKAEAPSS